MTDIAVVDYGMGNLRSVAKALAHVAPERSIVVSADPAVIRGAARVVLPGQSAMPDCMRCLDASGLRDVVVEAAATRPFLGICLGLQMLFETSEEGPTQGLAVLAGPVYLYLWGLDILDHLLGPDNLGALVFPGIHRDHPDRLD